MTGSTTKHFSDQPSANCSQIACPFRTSAGRVGLKLACLSCGHSMLGQWWASIGRIQRGLPNSGPMLAQHWHIGSGVPTLVHQWFASVDSALAARGDQLGEAQCWTTVGHSVVSGTVMVCQRWIFADCQHRAGNAGPLLVQHCKAKDMPDRWFATVDPAVAAIGDPPMETNSWSRRRISTVILSQLYTNFARNRVK